MLEWSAVIRNKIDPWALLLGRHWRVASRVAFDGKCGIPRLFVWYKHSNCLMSWCPVGPTGAGYHCLLHGDCSDVMSW